MTDNQALAPTRSAILQMARDLKGVDQEDIKKGIDKDDSALADLAGLPGWKVIKQYILDKKKALKPNYDGIDKLDDDIFFRNLGLRTMVYDLISEQFDDIIDKVESTSQEVQDIRKDLWHH